MENIILSIKKIPPEKAKKKMVLKKMCKRKEKSKKLYGAPGLPIRSCCGHMTKSLQCEKLISSDYFHFHKSFYDIPNKILQDNFILQHCKVTKTQRRRPKTAERNPKNITVKYFIPIHSNGKHIPVCRKTFLGALRLKKGRVQGVTKRYLERKTVAKENRGGDRKKFLYAAKREAVEKFIQKFVPLEIHYTRGKDRQRLYLHPDLNINKMCTMYNDQAQVGHGVSKGLFRLVFNTSFNIGFGSPRQNMCSTCLQLQERIKIEKSDATKIKLMTQLRIHKLRAKAFTKYLKEERDDLFTISFDCQKNLPLPKIPDQAVYYSRQLYFYNFTIVVGSSKQKLGKDNVHAYVWTEGQSAKGSNEICSCVFHCLNSMDYTNKSVVRLVADGCGGQNKNSMLIAMAMKWLITAPSNIERVEIIFPVTGHSYLPPDRVFALTEKKIKRKEVIIKPEEYVEVVSEHATVHKLTVEVPVLDWKETCKENLKPTQSWHFQISKIKRVCLERNNNKIKVRGEISYNNDLSVAKSILKRGKLFQHIDPVPISPGVSVKPAKLADVQKLLDKHYGPNWKNEYEELEFYKKILELQDNVLHDLDEEDNINDSEEVLSFV
ncbi:unnamed protein product [Euphydryas editha]|uniref:DUF7869 domain-containing protein n=1 Tax=Euphydryas editha TaxID=104508 RepID=A0AAU9UWI2_EUPED|nr:unnamed protein product [Euphydryas editha]